MKEIDFLPATYRERYAVRKAWLCQIAMVVSFGAITILAACFQFALYQSAKQELTLIAPQHEDALEKTGQLAALRAQAEQNRQFAELYTYLKYPWPRTQMLAEIVENLPPQVTLEELTIVEEEAPQTRLPTAVIAVDVAKSEATGGTPAKEDLDALRKVQDRASSEIQISGTTIDSAALHLFVMALNGTPLFSVAKLHSLEAVSGSEQPHSKFLIRLTVRPGYGQPDGPQSLRAVAAGAQNSARSHDRS